VEVASRPDPFRNGSEESREIVFGGGEDARDEGGSFGRLDEVRRGKGGER
jgi:hypothetical protein